MTTYITYLQEQRHLLEELLEEEKREQEKQAVSIVSSEVEGNGQSQTLLSNEDFERLRVDVLNPALNPPQGIPAQGLLPIHHPGQRQSASETPNVNTYVQHNTGVRPQFIQRSVSQTQWRPNMPITSHPQQVATNSIPSTSSLPEVVTVKKEG